LKGAGFSPYIELITMNLALAPEEIRRLQALKIPSIEGYGL
jgi:hypothetical protein